MQAVLETTDWGDVKCPNHTYLLDGNNLVAYIKQGETTPFYFKSPIKGFDKRGRKFVELATNPFDTKVETTVKTVLGSKGQTYHVDVEAGTCTCPGYTFRGTCKHVKEAEAVAC
jgi:hypothetical protein